MFAANNTKTIFKRLSVELIRQIVRKSYFVNTFLEILPKLLRDVSDWAIVDGQAAINYCEQQQMKVDW